MIKNDRQYRTTLAAIRDLERDLGESTEQGTSPLHDLVRRSVEGQITNLKKQLAEYEAYRDGKVSTVEFASLADFSNALIQGRIAARLTQKELAERLGLKEQQIQRYEASDYASASLQRIQEVANALGISVRCRVLLPMSDAENDQSEHVIDEEQGSKLDNGNWLVIEPLPIQWGEIPLEAMVGSTHLLLAAAGHEHTPIRSFFAFRESPLICARITRDVERRALLLSWEGLDESLRNRRCKLTIRTRAGEQISLEAQDANVGEWITILRDTSARPNELEELEVKFST